MKGTREPPFPSRRRCAPSRTIPSYAYRPSHATLVSHSHGSDRVFLAGGGSGRGSRTAAVGAGAGRRGRVGPVLVERCILHSRCAVKSARSSAKCTSRRPGAGRADPEVGVIAEAAVRAGARGGAGCPNLLQRPRSRRSAGRETLIFRAFSRRRSRPGAPLQQIWTRPRPGPPQESHAHHHALAHSRHRADPGPRPVAPDEKDPLTPFPGRAGAVAHPKVTRRPPFPPRRRHSANSARSCRPPGPTAAARLSPPGRRCGRWDP